MATPRSTEAGPPADSEETAMRTRIDACIDARMPWLARPGPLAAVSRKVLNAILSYETVVDLAESFRDADWHEIMAELADLVAKRVSVSGLDRVPAQGAALIVANHPTGIADGIVLHSLLRERRPDTYFFARGDVVDVFPQMKDFIAPVELREEGTGATAMRELMAFVRSAMDAGRLGVIFPAGRTGGLVVEKGIRFSEPPWIGSAAMLARKFDVPIIPVHISARNSALFYLFDFIHPSLGDVALFHETLNKARQHYRVGVGTPISSAALPSKSGQAIEMLQEACLSLSPGFRPSVRS